MNVLALYVPKGCGDGDLASSWVNPVRHTAEKSAVLCVTAVSSVRGAACDSGGRAVPALSRHRTGSLWIQSMQGTGPEY